MSLNNKIIFTGFSPNLTVRDTKTACKFIFLPWRWLRYKKGTATKKTELWIQNYFCIPHAYMFDSGRSALLIALKSLEIKEGDEVLVQAYTCIVVVNAIRWAGAKPIFVDVLNDANMDPDDAIKKITQKTKVLIIQHTFGKPANLERLINLAKRYDLKTIEDCAHSLGVKYNTQFTGTFADIGMFSFGTDKVISCARGGALISTKTKICEQIQAYQKDLKYPHCISIWQHLMHYLFFFVGKKWYHIGIGKALLKIGKIFHITSRIISQREKEGIPIAEYPAKLPNALATILLDQLTDLNMVQNHRRRIAALYTKGLDLKLEKEHGYLRFLFITERPHELHTFAKSRGIILGDWYNTIIAPKDINKICTNYTTGDCPHAENLSKHSINLPTNRNVTEKDAQNVIRCIKNFIKK